jgi:hypothetical protein
MEKGAVAMDRWSSRAGRGAAGLVLAVAAGLVVLGVVGTDGRHLGAQETLAIAGLVLVLAVASAVRSSTPPRNRR